MAAEPDRPGGSVAAAPMEGNGAYNRHSSVQGSALAPAIAKLVEAAAAVPLPPPAASLAIADYGCAQGHNSLRPIGAALAALGPRFGEGRAVSVFHTDLPGNDWAALFDTIARDPASYRKRFPQTFAAAIGGSFFTQLLPADSVTLGWSSWALHWLSAVPVSIPDHLQVGCSRDAGVRAAFAAQAARDWESFLAARAAELRPGGRIVLLFRADGGTATEPYLGIFDAAWRAVLELEGSGFLSAGERAHMVVPTYHRSLEEIRAPFAAGDFHGLAIEHDMLALGEDPIWRDTGQGADAASYAAGWASFFRAAAFPTLAGALDDSGGPGRRHEFFDRAEAAMRTYLAQDRINRAMPLACLTLMRRER